MNEYIPTIGDLVQLLSGTVVEITDDLSDEPYFGYDLDTGDKVEFYFADIDCYKKAKINLCGGDNSNYFMFYTGPGYGISKEDIANWGKFVYNNLFGDMSIEEIMHKHIYWATDSMNYASMYNGDTWVLYNNITLLPTDKRIDAGDKSIT